MSVNEQNVMNLAALINKSTETIEINGFELSLFTPKPIEIRQILVSLGGGKDDKETTAEEGMDMLIDLVGKCLRVEDKDQIWAAIVASGGILPEENPLLKKCMKMCGLEGDIIDPKMVGLNRAERRALVAQQRKDKKNGTEEQPATPESETTDVP